MSITQERMTTLLLTIKHLKDSTDTMQATINSYLQSSTDPKVLLVMLSELAASQKLPDNLYENYVQELAHFKARGKINLAKRRYNEKQRLLATGEVLAGQGIEELKLEHAQRAQAMAKAIAKPDKRQISSPPPPDTPKEDIKSWERFYGVTYDWSQWTGPQAPMVEDWSLKASLPPGHGEADVFVLEDEDAALAEAQAAFLANNKKYQSKE
jgi:hypothetical protein